MSKAENKFVNFQQQIFALQILKSFVFVLFGHFFRQLFLFFFTLQSFCRVLQPIFLRLRRKSHCFHGLIVKLQAERGPKTIEENVAKKLGS